MKYTFEQIKEMGVDYMPMQSFVETYHPKITFQAIRTACLKNKLDYFVFKKGKYSSYFIALTEFTLLYTPNRSSNRNLKK